MPQRSTKELLCYLMQFVLLCGFLCVLTGNVEAASLFGKVVEVNSGDVITISNLNRPVRVKLLGVDAPEMSQEFGDVAQKHLSGLTLDKFVLVEYSGIAADRSLMGRVLLNGTDIGAQMIRDGVAWFDPYNQSRLSATDREVYEQSEFAARLEGRGLWQQDNPIAPWEFVKAEALKKNPVVSLDNDSSSRVRRNAGENELTNLTLMTAGMRRTTSRSEIRAALNSLTATNKKLHELRPAGENFSVLVPEEGRQLVLPFGPGDESAEVNMHAARDGASIYFVFWFSAPSLGETDKVALGETVEDWIKSAHKSYEIADRGYFFCRQRREKDISMNGYTGREFDMSSCSLPTRARAFTRVVDNQRQMYIGIVFYGEDNENVGRFIRSFTVGRKNAEN
jgi:endonuclease YncB( thermonuclease family)